jgi:DNA-binding Lrp family transcriptional regulator
MELPNKVRDKLEELNKKSKHSVHIHIVKGRYYAYEYSSAYDGRRGKWKSIALYLGKINEEGIFTKAKYRIKPKTEAESVDELIMKYTKHGDLDITDTLAHPDDVDRKILEKISTDGRATVSEIAKYAKASRSKVQRRLHRLESLYGIKYTLDFAHRPFGLFRFYVLVKFRDSAPEVENMKDVLDKYPLIQTVALLKGDYDLFIYVLADNTASLEDMIYEIRRHKVFAPHSSVWTVSYIMQSYGFVPFRDKFFDTLRNKIWHKTREKPRKPENMLLERDFDVLYELNKNGKIDFNEIDAKYNMYPGAAHYTYHKLIEKKRIRRITITMTSLPLKYVALLLSTQIDISKFDKEKRNYFKYLLEDTRTPTNKFILIGDIGAPYGMMALLPVFGVLDMQKTEDSFHNLFEDGVKISTVIIVRLLIGNFGFRRLENKESVQYKLLHGTKLEETDIYP